MLFFKGLKELIEYIWKIAEQLFNMILFFNLFILSF